VHAGRSFGGNLLAGAAGLFTLFVSMAKQTKNGIISERTVRGRINDLDITKTWIETEPNGQRSGVGEFESSEGVRANLSSAAV